MKKISILGIVLASQLYFSQGFLKVDGQKIVDEKGNYVVLKGLGLGGWMLQEGYMLKTASFAGPQYQIKAKIAELIGEDGMNEFYAAYLKNGVTKKDIDALAKMGFNSVRLPMHYNLYTLPIEKEPVKGKNTWLEQGFKMTDDLLKWCADNKMYLILDLHGAPGGQGNDVNISDNDKSKPNLWDSVDNQNKTIELWKKLAERYKDEPWIGGYDLINEPNINFTGTNPNGTDEQSNAPLWKLQNDITKEIRKIDKKHIIFLEGNGWGNNYNGLTAIEDNNTALSFHKYWTNNDTAAIQGILDLRQKFNVPIWLGETGENSNVWFTELNQLLDKNNIGYAYWPMKKIDNIAGVTNVKITPEYQTLLNYWNKGGQKPSPEFAKKALMKIVDNYKLENTEVKKDVIDALFRQIHEDTTLPYEKMQVPGTIKATSYDLGRINKAYYDTDYQNLWVSDPNQRSEWNSGQKLRNDGVDIYQDGNSYYVGKTQVGEWLQYTFDAKTSGSKQVALEYASEKSGEVAITDAKGKLLATFKLNPTGSFTAWKSSNTSKITLPKGQNTIRIQFKSDGINLKSIHIK